LQEGGADERTTSIEQALDIMLDARHLAKLSVDVKAIRIIQRQGLLLPRSVHFE
jgi:hypothetical protein